MENMGLMQDAITECHQQSIDQERGGRLDLLTSPSLLQDLNQSNRQNNNQQLAMISYNRAGSGHGNQLK
jgi:hypothetical protein